MPFSIDRPLSAMVLAALLVLTTSSCHKKQVAVPVPSEPVPAVTAPAVEPPPQQQPVPAQPAAAPPATAPATAPAPKDETQYQKNKPPDQPPPPKHPAHPTTPASTAPAVQSPPPAPAPADTPRLGDILSPDQQREYNTAIDLSLAHAQASLGFISTRQLTHEQQSTVAEIQNFIQQAQEKRKNELEAAKSLAERAEVLSHDLVASLR